MKQPLIDEETANIIRVVAGLYDAREAGAPIQVIARLLARDTSENWRDLFPEAEWLFLPCKLAEKFGTEKALEIAHGAVRRRANLRVVGREL